MVSRLQSMAVMPPPLVLQLKAATSPWIVIFSASAMKKRAGVRFLPMTKVVSSRPHTRRTVVESVLPAKLRKILRPGSTVSVMLGTS